MASSVLRDERVAGRDWHLCWRMQEVRKKDGSGASRQGFPRKDQIMQHASAAARSFFRKCYRLTSQLPPGEQKYYRGFLRNHFAGHSTEDDPARVTDILARAEDDLLWLCNKYNLREHIRNAKEV